MNLLNLTEEFLNLLAQCMSINSALKLVNAKEVEIRYILSSAGFDVTNSKFLLRYEAQKHMKNEFYDYWQFIVDLITIEYALKGNWIPYENQPEYYKYLKIKVLSIRDDIFKSKSQEIALVRMSIIYQEIKKGLLKRLEPKIVCRFNPHKEQFNITFNDPIDSALSLKERVSVINNNVTSRLEGIGENTWAVVYGIDTQVLKKLISDNEFQHPELVRLCKELVTPY